MLSPSYLNFDGRSYPWKAGIDYRETPEKYRVGKGEQGVLICEPYRTEIGQHWRFKTPDIAEKSSAKILAMFRRYLREKDFVGADMARKFLQMGYTRARRYANTRVAGNTTRKMVMRLCRAEPAEPKKPLVPLFSMTHGGPRKQTGSMRHKKLHGR